MDFKPDFRGLFLILLLNGVLVREVDAGIGLKPLDFLRLGDKELAKEIKIIFNPNDGIQLRENYEKKYGVRGEDLIKRLGEGFNIIPPNPQTV